jgi:imidazolonepropionase-like amidohydrolase
MLERRVALTPTLTLWKYFLRHDRVSLQEQMTNAATGQLRAWIAEGGEVLFGTDLGAVDPDPSDEYALMEAAGMSFRQILASLTTAPGARFAEHGESGRIAVGFAADLTVLQDDPATDIRALATVQYTLRDGNVIYDAGESGE